MQSTPAMRIFLTLSCAQVAQGARTNPLAKVLELMNELETKVQAEGEAEAKAYKEYFKWCDDVSKNTQFEIKSAAASKEKLEAAIGQAAANIAAEESKIEELAASIAADTKQLSEATEIRAKEVDEFQKGEASLVDTVDTLDRAIAIIGREMTKNPAAFAQVDTKNGQKLAKALGSVLDAAAFSLSGKDKLMALVQDQQNADDDDLDTSAPEASAYGSHSDGIMDVLGDLKEKAEGELSDLRKAEGNAKHNFEMLKQSLEDQMKADNKNLDDSKSRKAENEESKATAEGDLALTTKDLAQAQTDLTSANNNCMQTAADHEATVTKRKEELNVIAQAKKIIKESTAGAVAQSYSFLQSSMSTEADLEKIEIVSALKQLAKKSHSAALSQLASRVDAVVKYGGSSGEDVFAKIKQMVSDMIQKLEREAEDDATEKAYCDEEMAKTEAKKSELQDDLSKLSAKIDQDSATSAQRKQEVTELQQELAALAREQADMDMIRAEQHAAYAQSKDELEQGISGVQRALSVLRDYYQNAGSSLMQEDGDLSSLMQQPAVPEQHSPATGAGQSIINILEVCESDFSENLAKIETEEADESSQYDKTTQENKVSKTMKDQDVKYKTQEFKSLDKEVSELSGDKNTLNTEYMAVLEYYSKLKDRCIAKPMTYAERKARRESEIAGLKDALAVLEENSAFVQRKRRGAFRGAIQ